MMSLTLAIRPLRARRAKIGAIGTYVPPRVLINKDLEEMVETSDEWIYSRVGIRQRYLVEKGMATSDMAVEAAKRCLDSRKIVATDVEAIIVATVTPDMLFPATACLVQDKLGAKGAWGFDLSAACSGFVYALQMGAKLVESVQRTNEFGIRMALGAQKRHVLKIVFASAGISVGLGILVGLGLSFALNRLI